MTYILHHIEAALQFVFGKREALYGIDATWRGLKLSFLVILIIEPINFIYAALFGFMDRMFLFREGGFPVYLLQLFLDWGLVPLVLFGLSGLFAFRDRLIPLIVSYNWMSVVVMVLTLLPSALISSQIAGREMTVFIMMGIYAFAMWVTHRLIIFVLECPVGMAAALTVLIMILNVASAATLSQISLDMPMATDTVPN